MKCRFLTSIFRKSQLRKWFVKSLLAEHSHYGESFMIFCRRLCLRLAVVFWRKFVIVFCSAILFSTVCAQERFKFDPTKLSAMDAAIEQAILERRMPGAVLWVEHDGVSHVNSYGHRALEPQMESMTRDTIF